MRKSFVDLSENIFCSVLSMPCDEEISAEKIKDDFIEKIKEFCNDSASNGYTSGETENAKYAICAWIDEYIYTNTNISSQWFSHSLVLTEFEDAEAGRHFFEKIESFHKNKDSVPLLELYAKCILFGFMGKFRIGGTAELKQILNSAISKTGMYLEEIKYKSVTKNKHLFSFRRGIKNILVTGLCEDKCKNSAKTQEPPKGYKYIYSDMRNIDELPFIDGIVLINPLQVESDSVEKQNEPVQKLSSKQKCKVPIYAVADLEIQEFTQTIDKNYEFNSNHLNYYLHKYFLDEIACRKILSLPGKLEQFKKTDAFYSLPFFPFMKNEKPLAYSLSKRVFIVSFLAVLLFSIIYFAVFMIGKHKEEIKAEAMFLLQKRKLDSIKAVEDSLERAREDSIRIARDSIKALQDSLNLEFETKVKNLERQYQKLILEKFPFKEGKTPSVGEVSGYFGKESDFYKFLDIIDTISDDRIKFNKKTLAALSLLKNNTWSGIPVSINIQAPKMASVKFGIDSQYVEIERGQSKVMEVVFPQKNKGGIELVAKTANNAFSENISGEWSLLKLRDRHEFSFVDKSYSIDIELNVRWHLPKDAIKPNDWFKLRMESNLIENSRLTNNLGE
ncbi:MAG: DotU family type IV/VI secretion system protein [Candidatus Fibromonas sp.]|jgi:type IV/VI secretion system ImpK/VasF family protein|nr:DotU family type IV/VI secretion system protein [Candidatus Fibromonas sp.]